MGKVKTKALKKSDVGSDRKTRKKLTKEKQEKSKVAHKRISKLKVLNSKFGKRLAIILVICIILPVFITGAVIFNQFRTYVEKDIYSNNEVILNTLESSIQNRLNSVGKVLTILSQVDYVQNLQPVLVKSMFVNVQDEYDLLASIEVYDSKGKAIFSTVGKLDAIDTPHFREALNGNLTYSNIIQSENGQGNLIQQAIPIYDRSGSVTGVLIGEISLEKFNLAVQNLVLPTDFEALIVSQEGKIVAHSNSDMFIAQQDKDFSELEPFKRGLAGERGSVEYTSDGESYLTSYQQLEGVNLGVVIQVPAAKAYAQIHLLTAIFTTILLVATVLGLIVSVVLSQYVTTPLQRVSDSALIASGGDFTVHMDEKTFARKDEFGDLARSFMVMIEAFKEIIMRLKTSTNVLDETTYTLVNASEETRNEMTMIIKNADELKETAHDDIQLSRKVVGAVEEMAKGSENVALNTERLNVLIKNNVDFASRGVEMMSNTAGLVQKTFNSYEMIETRIRSLEKSAVDIGSITDTIMEIANQTNLLALNAAIEAARAGDAGRGFAVVAGEIRNLADQSNKSAESITTIIKEIQNDIKDTSGMFSSTSEMLENVVSESEKTVGQINEILEDSKKAAESVDEISAVTEEQAAASAQINEMMENMLETIQETAGTSDQMAERINIQKAQSDKTIAMIEEIKQLSEEIKSMTGQFNC
ncbi:methyl-accepting chemotaxis protein [Fusibacter ferrireducens]|uniref:Methyl-accepting chemotaxis protein n=1 Tax=Fusibacter ferrireducens TaxID=2785058 RepID=A0ABR9ZYR7_9FIRM|nr:methyl-accepting chemotaxis protein [Fusibacter ferrireducens]MBF4695597.1 methyl-accepting chemotaxis protein [Fusibacter ferrireducens]